jgi:hypothetical protein
MRQIRYTENNIELFYFTPFAIVEKASTQVVLIHTLTDHHLYLWGEEPITNRICDSLMIGVTENDLLFLLSKLDNYNHELMDFMIQEGIIE